MRILLAVVLASLPVIAVADTKPATPSAPADVTKMNTDDCARARKANKTCVLTIDDEKIEGGVPTGGGTTVIVPTSVNHGSLIRLRKDFIIEILKSAEDL